MVLALRSARVQTAAVAVLTEELSRALHVEAHIDRVDIRPPLSLQLQGVFLSDQQGDTLLYVPQIQVRFNPFALEEKCLCFPLVQLNSPTICLVQDSASSNIDFLVRAFHKDSPQPFSYRVECRKIAINDARVHYIHRPSHLDALVTNINTDVGFTYAGKDSLSAVMRALHAKVQMAPIDGYLEADFHGDLDTLYADRMQVVYRNQSIFLGDVAVRHLLQRDSLSAHLACTDLNVSAPLLSELLADIMHRPVLLPDFLTQMGTIRYRGVIDGQLDDLTLQGAFTTRIGTVSTNVHLVDKRSVSGSVRTTNLALGRCLHQPLLGNLSAAVTVQDCNLDSLPNMVVQGVVSKLDFKGYTYSNMQVQVSIARDSYTGQFSVDDPNLQIRMDAALQHVQSAPSLQVDIHAPKINLAQLHLTDSALQHSLSFSSAIHLHVDSTKADIIDRTVGSIHFDSMLVCGAGHRLLVPKVDMVVQSDSGQRHMSVTSSVLTAQIDGHFQWSTIPATIKGLIHQNIPSLVDAPAEHAYSNDMDFSAQILRMDDLLDVITPNKLTFPCVPSLTGYVHESDSSFAIRLNSDKVIKSNTAYQNMLLSLDNANPSRFARAHFYIMQHIISADSTRLKLGDLMSSIQFVAHHDSLTTAVEFGPIGTADSVPDLLIHTTFAQMKDAPSIDVHILPSDFQLGRADWHVDDAHIRYSSADKAVWVQQLHLYSDQQMLQVDGCMSTHPTDSLCIKLKDMDLGYLLSSTKLLDVMDIRGHMTGWATLYSAFATPQLEANLSMPDAQINSTPLGCVSAKAELDRSRGEIAISGSAVRDDVRLADIRGRVVPTKPAAWDLYIDSNGLPLDFINFWTTGIVEQIRGAAYGPVHIFGRNRRVWVTTRAYAKDAAVTVPSTGCRYFFSDSIVMDTASITFPAIHLRDAAGHPGLLTGQIRHTNFRNFQFQIDAQCNKILGLNLPASSGSMYYGKAYATGNVQIRGNQWMTRIDVDASTAENTDFFLSLATASNASSSEFITFRQPDTLEVDSAIQAAKPKARFLLNLSIEATPQAKIHLVLDPHNGDGIVGRGEGNIRLSMDATTGDVQMLGTYTLLSGTFSYTVGNLIHRDFSISEGSTVSWSGDATNPKLDIIAKYRCTASLRDLFGADVKRVTSRPSIPVDCVVHITGTMNNMILKFGIEYPQSDESVAAQINAVINTEAMLMRQVVYLLVFNRFYTPESMRTVNTGLNDAYSLLSSTVTGQINSWLSKLTDMVNVGFNMRANTEQGQQSYETEANIQIQPVDRLTINGNVGYRYNDLSNQPIFGDADIEYELTADGKLRAKVFTHSVDKYSLHQSGMQEGVGFIFRHDFNPGDAKKRREAKRKEKESK